MLPAGQYLVQGKCKDCKEFGLTLRYVLQLVCWEQLSK